MKSDRYKEQQEIIQRIVNTTDGMMFTKYNIEDYIVNFKPNFNSPNEMYFDLGTQKWVKNFLKLIDDKDRFERVIIHSRFNKN